MTRPTTAVLVAIFVTTVAALSAQIPLRPGQYEETSEMDSGDRKMSRKASICFTSEDLKNDFPRAHMQARVNECAISDYKVSGNTVTFNAVCQMEGVKIVSSYAMTFATESYTYVMKSTANGRASTTSTTAKRTGECRK